MMNESQARRLAQDVSRKGVTAKVASQTTNGITRHVVHVTHAEPVEGERAEAFTLS